MVRAVYEIAFLGRNSALKSLRSSLALALAVSVSAIALNAQAAPRHKAETSAAPPPPVEALWSDMKWRLVGPFRGGWGEMVVGVPGHPDSFLFGASGGGVWRTDDAGETWRSLFDKGPQAVGALAVAPSNPDVIYIGTGQPEVRYDVQFGGGVFKSTDGGKSWSFVGLKDTRAIGKIWIDPSNPDVVMVAAMGHFFGPNPERGVFRSEDGGKSWTQALKVDNDTGVVDFAQDPKDPNVIFAAAWQVRQYPWQSYFTRTAGPGSAIYKSADRGRTWSKLGGNGWPSGSLGRIGIAATDTAKGVRLYATVDSVDAPGIYRSDDGGANWVRASDEDAVVGMYSARIAVQPDDPDVVYTVGQSVRRCDQGATHCEIIKGAPGGDDYHFVWVSSEHPDHMAVSSDQGTAVSVNGGKTWSDWYNQPTAQFYHIETDNRFPYWIYSGQQDSGTVGIASRGDYGSISFRDWHPVGGEERDYDVPDQNDPLIVYGSGLGGNVTRYDTRTGQVASVSAWPFSSYGQRPTEAKHRFNWITPLVPSRTGPATIYLGGEKVWASSDRGDHWKEISPDLTGKTEGAERCGGDIAVADAKGCGYGTITQIMPSSRHADELWVGTDDGLVQMTRDGGAHWTNVTPPAVALWARINSIDLSAQEDGVAYVAVDGQRLDDFRPHVFETRDYGANWRDISSDLPPDHIAAVVRADPVKPGLLYAGTDDAAFVSIDDGAHWRSLQSNLPTAWVRDLNVHGDDLIAATQGRSIWILDDVAPLREVTPEIASEAVHLFKPATAVRVHPNNNKDTPLPPETPLGENPPAGAIIDYWLAKPAKGPVEIDVLDASGAVVAQLSSEPGPKLPANRYFAKAWVKPEPVLSREAGAHRAVWSLHYPRPHAMGYGYDIAASVTDGTPILPEGPFALPGDYTVVLKVDGKEQRQSLHVVEDPRVTASADDLRAQLAFSLDVGKAMERAWKGAAEMTAAHDQLVAADKALAGRPKDAELRARVETLMGRTMPGAGGRRRGGEGFGGLSGNLTVLESGLESADAAPTAPDREGLADVQGRLDAAWAKWTDLRDHDLAQLSADLKKAGLKPLTYAALDRVRLEAPDYGEDID
jgi:photosystem II stability/assembly factor-like uncharacterized protein